MNQKSILEVAPLGFPWETADPFLFCVHHDDAYPEGNDAFGPAASLQGRNIGQDFAGKDGWRMYHGDVVPGFPQHPHRGFETVTIVRRGFIDHSDSLGAKARFGEGDVQWLTAGKGIVHSEMFPLLRKDAPNPVELFQIWLNLPSTSKFAQPHFSMLWRERIPVVHLEDERGAGADITIVAGTFGELVPPAPPPDSWAARSHAAVAIWTIRMDANATLTLPRYVDPVSIRSPQDPAAQPVNRTLYFFRGKSAIIAGETFDSHAAIVVRSDVDIDVVAGPDGCELLMLQGRSIGERVAQYGPFVMNTQAEIEQAFADYRRTKFGGWPWQSDGPVHGGVSERFAVNVDGREERPPEK
ncbi:MAG: pirin family protein [Polyangiaceae bacterium]